MALSFAGVFPDVQISPLSPSYPISISFCRRICPFEKAKDSRALFLECLLQVPPFFCDRILPDIATLGNP